MNMAFNCVARERWTVSITLRFTIVAKDSPAVARNILADAVENDDDVLHRKANDRQQRL
jgi:hypothetical protein